MNGHPVSDDDLLAYAAGDRDQGNTPDLAAHIATCPACAATLARFALVQSTVRADATLVPAAMVTARVKALIAGRPQQATDWPTAFAALKRIVASITFDGRATVAPAGLRGSTADAYLLRYSTDEVDIDLEFAPDEGAETEHWQITGQVSAAEATGALALVFTEAGRTRPVVEVLSDDDGMFFANLSRGRYDLLIRTAENAIVVPDLEVG